MSKYAEHINEFLGFINHEDFKTGNIDFIDIETQINIIYPNLELNVKKAPPLEDEVKKRLIDAIDTLSSNSHLVNDSGYKKFAFTLADLNQKHNNLQLNKTFEKLNLSLPLPLELFEFFAINRNMTFEILNFRRHFKVKEFKKENDLDSNSPEFVYIVETIDILNKHSDDIHQRITSLFGDVKEPLRKELFPEDSSPSMWYAQYLYSRVYNEPLPLNSLKNMCSVLGKRWSRGFVNFPIDKALETFEETNFISSIMPSILKNDIYGNLDVPFDQVCKILTEDVFGVNEKESLMFINKEKRENIINGGFLFSNFIEDCTYLKKWDIERAISKEKDIALVDDTKTPFNFKL